MGREEFTSAVGGVGGTALATSTKGTVETDNYPTGGAFDIDPNDGDAYPVTLNPAALMQELVVTASGDGVVLELTTTGGSTFTVPLRGATGAFDKWELDEVVIKDPASSGGVTSGGWAGE